MDNERRVKSQGCCDEILVLKNVICGNGVPGIADLVSSHETYIQQQKGFILGLKFILGIFTISNVVLLIKLFSR
jgi:hypothetical protein